MKPQFFESQPANAAQDAYSASLYGAMIEDIMVYRDRLDKLEYQASHDGLTGFFNQAAWRERLDSKIEAADENSQFGVLFLDLTRMKLGNDTVGHERMDKFLIDFTHKLNESLRTGDKPSSQPVARGQSIRIYDVYGFGRKRDRSEDNLPGRKGGDEFVILCDLTPRPDSDYKATSEKRLEVIGNHVYAVFNDLLIVQEPEFQAVGLDLAMGGAVWRPGQTGTELLKEADTAMYKNKQTQYPDGAPR